MLLSLAEIDQLAHLAANEENVSTLLDLFEELSFRKLEPKKIRSIKGHIINVLAETDELELFHNSSSADVAKVRSHLIRRYKTLMTHDKRSLPAWTELKDKTVNSDIQALSLEKNQPHQLVDRYKNDSEELSGIDSQDREDNFLESDNCADILLQRIATGKAILFTGAGFSRGTTNVEDLEPPLASQLAEKICEVGNFPISRDLRFAADYFIANCNDKNKLISLLKRQFDLKRVDQTHVSICKIKWRRFYTTNYDKSIEAASRESGKVVECIDIFCSPREYYKREGLCVHLNGSLDALTTESLETRFKLSTSSYVSADAFTNSEWKFYFRKDLERSAATVFVGYSMYDIEIQRVLHSNSTLKEKTYFITSPSPSHDLLYTLSKYGHVLPIGIEGLARLISNNAGTFKEVADFYVLKSLVEYELQEDTVDVRDSTVERFFLYGYIDDSLIDEAVSGTQRVPYLILRRQAANAFAHMRKGKNVLVYSELGNGKTTLVCILRTMLLIEGYRVFYVGDLDEDFIEDLDFLAKSDQQVILILDGLGLEPYFDLIRHLSYTQPQNIRVLIAARTTDYEHSWPKLVEHDRNYVPIGIDELTDDDTLDFIKIIDNLGYWASDAGKSIRQKQNIIREKCKNQLSLSLLHLFKAPQIRDRLDALLLGLLENNIYKLNIFCICILSILDIPAEQSLISDMAGNDEIFSLDLVSASNFKQLFRISSNRVSSRSGLFSIFLVHSYFSPAYITKHLQGIASRLNCYTKKDAYQDKVFKNALRFSFIERLLPDKKKNTLLEHYENLKIVVPWLKTDPNFWLQYAMANITHNDFEKAQTFLEQAYSLAYSKQDYNTQSIDTQQARLLIKKSIGKADPASAFSSFEQAHRLMINIDETVYKYRQVPLYKDFFDTWGTRLSKKNTVLFQQSCKRIMSDINEAESSSAIGYTSIAQCKKAKDAITSILHQLS